MSTKDPDYVYAQTGQVIGAFMTEDHLEELLPAAREATMTRAMGALVSFEGIVRDHDGGQRVATLTYSSHPTADAEITRIAQEIVVKHPHVRVWTAHRTGPIPIGEAAFIVLAAAAHRGDAFAAASELADRVKAEVPIWKEQELASGDTQWVGLN
ncbi:molybdenum cofactor biosynthesis protein MoaE [Corynebacterium lubricantis]|uniref:molybdenum cofactor biosynthesis protein MoaE n=1 Tax=Corynebacterium lubricantis TaxID=541095 RepID=UPI00036DE8FA|nr:molybdenum cofactor biosynthesis protein MoaE [Corynebacterium lubricantis]